MFGITSKEIEIGGLIISFIVALITYFLSEPNKRTTNAIATGLMGSVLTMLISLKTVAIPEITKTIGTCNKLSQYKDINAISELLIYAKEKSLDKDYNLAQELIDRKLKKIQDISYEIKKNEYTIDEGSEFITVMTPIYEKAKQIRAVSYFTTLEWWGTEDGVRYGELNRKKGNALQYSISRLFLCDNEITRHNCDSIVNAQRLNYILATAVTGKDIHKGLPYEDYLVADTSTIVVFSKTSYNNGLSVKVIFDKDIAKACIAAFNDKLLYSLDEDTQGGLKVPRPIP